MDNKRIGLLALAALLALLVVACDDIVLEDNDPVSNDTGDDDDAGDDDNDTGDDDTGDDDTVDEPTYDNFAEGFFASYCTRCHQDPPRNSAPFALNTYEAVQSRLGDIRRVAVDSTFMPLTAPFPTDAERETLGAWIDAGAPRN